VKPAPPPHDCPGCGVVGIAADRAVCSDCWQRVPMRLRAPVIIAWMHRVQDPEGFQEALADVFLWYRDQRAVPQ
jgi:hypothetical protein